jgi:ATP-dependent Clp protease adapter protein ClpS
MIVVQSKNGNKMAKNKLKGFDLYIYNDDINEYDYVVQTLSTLLSYSPLQAENCANLIQANGKYKVKSYDVDDEQTAKLILENLLDYKLKAELVNV